MGSNPNHSELAKIHEIKVDALSSVGVQNMDINKDQASDLEDIEFHWEDRDLDMDAVFRPELDTLFPPSTIIDIEIGNPSLVAEA